MRTITKLSDFSTPKTQFFQTTFLLLFLLFFTAFPCNPALAEKSDNDIQYSSVEERRLYLAIQQERDNLSLERKKLNEKKKELKTIETEVDKKLDQLQVLREQIKVLIADKNEKEDQKIKELSKMYEKMSSAKAARILGSLNNDLAISILEKMKIKSAAKILDSMDKDKAVRLTDAFSNLDIK